MNMNAGWIMSHSTPPVHAACSNQGDTLFHALSGRCCATSGMPKPPDIMRSMMKPRKASSDARRGVGAGEVVDTGAVDAIVAAAGAATGVATSAEGTSALSMTPSYVARGEVLHTRPRCFRNNG